MLLVRGRPKSMRLILFVCLLIFCDTGLELRAFTLSHSTLFL
jgi:hypothetical protein